MTMEGTGLVSGLLRGFLVDNRTPLSPPYFGYRTLKTCS